MGKSTSQYLWACLYEGFSCWIQIGKDGKFIYRQNERIQIKNKESERSIFDRLHKEEHLSTPIVWSDGARQWTEIWKHEQ